MKRLLVCLILCAVCSQSRATTPFRPKVFANDNFTYIVGFAWADQNDKILIVRSVRKTHMYSRKDLGFKDLELMSTAGSMWYQQSIGFVAFAKVREGENDADTLRRIFYFRDKKGNEAIIDVNSGRMVTSAQIVEKDKLKKMAAADAAKLLKSKNPRDRQTAAIHLGQLKAKEYREELKKLLKDNSHSTCTSTKRGTWKEYYVKDAAAKALEQINAK